MEKCLVTKLKSAVDNSNLLKIGEFGLVTVDSGSVLIQIATAEQKSVIINCDNSDDTFTINDTSISFPYTLSGNKTIIGNVTKKTTFIIGSKYDCTVLMMKNIVKMLDSAQSCFKWFNRCLDIQNFVTSDIPGSVGGALDGLDLYKLDTDNLRKLHMKHSDIVPVSTTFLAGLPSIADIWTIGCDIYGQYSDLAPIANQCSRLSIRSTQNIEGTLEELVEAVCSGTYDTGHQITCDCRETPLTFNGGGCYNSVELTETGAKVYGSNGTTLIKTYNKSTGTWS